MDLVALGVGDAFSARYYSSCVAVGAQGEWLQVDCPHPIRKILREASASSGVALDLVIHSAALPAATRQRLRLIHYPDDFEPDSSAIEPLRQGAAYRVGRAGDK